MAARANCSRTFGGRTATSMLLVIGTEASLVINEHYCRDLNGWPRSWMRLEKDLPPGEQLVSLFGPFLEHLAASDLSPKTIQNVDNMRALGGEFIRDLHNDPL